MESSRTDAESATAPPITTSSGPFRRLHHLAMQQPAVPKDARTEPFTGQDDHQIIDSGHVDALW
ncbi:hypothetical protein [Arthrobacter sp. ISL-30]|uniref:hypothetical protein n=1 Tax=Arthrobacter sp. ISL-30 TaxID=2819109 RepID=UPI001BE7BC50|nr:hypothetical protein [Arthrobacter sp. ISL-30]MBT2514476.1 hypothetical protein [Arthrobacter sp. ISL-30]